MTKFFYAMGEVLSGELSCRQTDLISTNIEAMSVALAVGIPELLLIFCRPT